VPAAQALQATAPAIAEKKPAEQPLQRGAPAAAEKKPTAQTVQAFGVVAPDVARNVPA